MTFHVGQKIVCVDAETPSFVMGGYGSGWDDGEAPVLNAVYTIARIFFLDNRKVFDLVEIKRSAKSIRTHGGACGYGSWRFRPVEPKCAQLFRAIAAGVSNGSPIIDDPQPQQVPLSPETIRELIGGGAIRI